MRDVARALVMVLIGLLLLCALATALSVPAAFLGLATTHFGETGMGEMHDRGDWSGEPTGPKGFDQRGMGGGNDEGGPPWPVWFLFPLVTTAVLLVGATPLVVWAGRRLVPRRSAPPQPAQSAAPQDAMSVLRARYASGELSTYQYELMRDQLASDGWRFT